MCRARGIGRQARGNATAPSPIAAAAIGARPRSAPARAAHLRRRPARGRA
ncbi:hypothetical protein BURPSPAST_H0233 [Burkholderia pseudomallei Pasteur 52237]|nr:hypothetical protein BURPSPAST_H0233 [Burkholderia pseudomallei Pasteur 52237]